MDGELLQLSQEEWLLLLGLARLPLPLALGEQPMAGYTPETLGAVLQSATHSLLARSVLQPGPTGAPQMSPAVAALLRDSALAQAALLGVRRQGTQLDTQIYTWRHTALVAHTRPAPRVHRLERLAHLSQALERLTCQIQLPVSQCALELQAPVEALSATLEAAAAGQQEVARRALHTAGAPERLVLLFLEHLGAAPVQYVWLALQALAGPAPVATSSMLIVGRAAAWWVDEPPASGAMVQLQRVDAAAVQTRRHALLQRLAHTLGDVDESYNQ